MDYESLRSRYKPDTIKYLFIAEAPPEPKADPRFFYLPRVLTHDWLFLYSMKAIYSGAANQPNYLLKTTKADWLARFERDGFYLIDAVTKPIPQACSSTERERIIRASAHDLIERTRPLLSDNTKIVLIKATVYNALYIPLREAGLPVINTQAIDFPSNGNQPKFLAKMQELLGRHKIDFTLDSISD